MNPMLKFPGPHRRYFKPGLAALCLLLSTPGFAAPVPTPRLKTGVTDAAGVSHTLPNPARKATVLVFISHDCPISNSYAPELNRIAREYALRGVEMFLVYAEDGFSASEAREHARQFGYRVPVIVDIEHRLSRDAGATVTPQAAVFAPDGRRLYLGRIDNRYLGYGKARAQATERDLRTALDAVLAGKAVPQPVTTAIGCFIPGTSE
jgi:hypothetical protein